LAKYDRKGIVRLRDVLRIVHPKPQDDEQSKMWKMLLDGTLPTPETWETAISDKGSSKESWEKIIPKMGYMALLRNLRNFLKHDVDIDPVLKKLADPDEVRKSKQFPFRFFSAYAAVADAIGELDTGWGSGHSDDYPNMKKGTAHKVMDAMQRALEVSVENVPRLKGSTFMTADNSASMGQNISERSAVQVVHIANILQSMAHKICDDEAITSVFGQNFATVYASKSDGVITNMEKFQNKDVGHSTEAWKSIAWLNQDKVKVDRIIIFSDMQCYGSDGNWGSRGQSLAEQFQEYKANVNSKVKLYSIDLAGYGTAQFPEDDGSVVLLAGWSERLLEFINRYEETGETAIEVIKKTNPREPKRPKQWFSKPQKSLDKMTVAELKGLAKKRNIDIPSSARKADIVKALSS
jgi:hypothetical protein